MTANRRDIFKAIAITPLILGGLRGNNSDLPPTPTPKPEPDPEPEPERFVIMASTKDGAW